MARNLVQIPQLLWNSRVGGLRGIDPAGGLGLWPLELIKPAHWLDAADKATLILTSGKLSQWSDKSGNGYHATQSNASYRPTLAVYNGFEVVAFSNSYLLHNFSVNEPNMVFAVFAHTNAAADQAVYQASSANVPLSSTIHARTSSSANWATYMNSERYATSSFANRLGIACLVSESPMAGGKSSLYSNGAFDISYTDTRYSDGAQRRSVGGDGPTYTHAWLLTGYIAEIIVVKTIAMEVRDLIQGYLAHKWGLAADLPLSHPYKSMPPFVSPQYATAYGSLTFKPWFVPPNRTWDF